MQKVQIEKGGYEKMSLADFERLIDGMDYVCNQKRDQKHRELARRMTDRGFGWSHVKVGRWLGKDPIELHATEMSALLECLDAEREG